jgi:hypothetical protein
MTGAAQTPVSDAVSSTTIAAAMCTDGFGVDAQIRAQTAGLSLTDNATTMDSDVYTAERVELPVSAGKKSRLVMGPSVPSLRIDQLRSGALVPLASPGATVHGQFSLHGSVSARAASGTVHPDATDVTPATASGTHTSNLKSLNPKHAPQQHNAS